VEPKGGSVVSRTFAETQFALRLLDARLPLVRALAEMRRLREDMIIRGPSDELARARWKEACATYQLAVERAESLDEALLLSDELAGKVSS
jgi:hypothetical protein